MLLALSSTQELVLGLTAAAFVVFALVSAMVIPRSRPDFPGRHVGWFIAVAAVFTIGMLAAVLFVARETGEEEAAAGQTKTYTTPIVPTTATTETTPTTSETETTSETTTTSESTTTSTPAAQGDPIAGKKVFLSAGCTGCHTLSDAGSTGTVGPNLDAAQPSYDKVVERVTNGKSPMPPFAGTLTPRQIEDVAAYVSSTAGS